MSYFIILMGVSGCGKTTIGKMTAKTLGVPYYEGDEYHPKENVEKMSQGIPLNDEDRDSWLQRLADLMQQKLAEGDSGVLSCSALKKKYRDRLRIDPEKVHFIYLKGNYELIRERMEKRRDHYMPADLLRSQFETLEEPGDVFTIEIDQKPSEILSQAMFYITNKIQLT
jgi:carbohydrate kinase (thermoresistant glucokinase family)